MLTALLNGMKVDAGASIKGPEYVCPNCGGVATLKKGRIVTHHFAHKPPTTCTWATGETQEHLAAKIALRDAFRHRGYSADYEVEVLSSGGDRRADVYVTSPDRGRMFAIEVQHTPILYDAIERRTKAYIAANVPVMWLGIFTEKMRASADRTTTGYIIRQYVIRPWEKWASALNFGELWFIDSSENTLWRGSFTQHLIEVPASSWYEQGGEERSAGGYTRPSKKWRTFHLDGPHYLHALDDKIKWRKSWSSSAFSLPSGYIARFEPRS